MLKQGRILGNRDFQFYDCRVDSYKLTENSIIVYCKYRGCDNVQMILSGVHETFCIEFMPNHIIEYVFRTFDELRKVWCYEIHYKGLVEVTCIWADSMIYKE